MGENDERVKDFWKISGLKYNFKLIDYAGLEDEVKNLIICLYILAVLY